MDLISSDNGKTAVIKTPKEFVLIIDDEILGPFPNTKEKVKELYRKLKDSRKA